MAILGAMSGNHPVWDREGLGWFWPDHHDTASIDGRRLLYAECPLRTVLLLTGPTEAAELFWLTVVTSMQSSIRSLLPYPSSVEWIFHIKVAQTWRIRIRDHPNVPSLRGASTGLGIIEALDNPSWRWVDVEGT